MDALVCISAYFSKAGQLEALPLHTFGVSPSLQPHGDSMAYHMSDSQLRSWPLIRLRFTRTYESRVRISEGTHGIPSSD